MLARIQDDLGAPTKWPARAPASHTKALQFPFRAGGSHAPQGPAEDFTCLPKTNVPIMKGTGLWLRLRAVAGDLTPGRPACSWGPANKVLVPWAEAGVGAAFRRWPPSEAPFCTQGFLLLPAPSRSFQPAEKPPVLSPVRARPALRLLPSLLPATKHKVRGQTPGWDRPNC